MNIKEKDILNMYANKIVHKNLAVVAIFFLESTKYISFIGGQMLIFLGPITTLFINDKQYYDFDYDFPAKLYLFPLVNDEWEHLLFSKPMLMQQDSA